MRMNLNSTCCYHPNSNQSKNCCPDNTTGNELNQLHLNTTTELLKLVPSGENRTTLTVRECLFKDDRNSTGTLPRSFDEHALPAASSRGNFTSQICENIKTLNLTLTRTCYIIM
jgi:hypothetical protein